MLPDPAITTVFVMVGAPGSGKSTEAARLAALHPDAVIVDVCHSKPWARTMMVGRIRDAGKRAIAVHMMTPLGLCKARQHTRTLERQVSMYKVMDIHHAISSAPPTVVEGWHEVQQIVDHS